MMKWMSFAPELYCLLAALWFLVLSLVRRPDPRREHLTSLVLAALGVVVCLASVNAEGYLFVKAYRVDLFSQVFKVMLALGLFFIRLPLPETSPISRNATGSISTCSCLSAPWP